MASRRQQAVGMAMDDTAAIVDAVDALKDLALLVAAISRRNLWHEVAWEPEQAAADAQRAVARVRHGLERALELAAARTGEL